MNETYLALNNSMMSSFIENCGLFSINDDINYNYKFLFCDSLELGSKIKAKVKIYICSDKIEYTYDMSNYKNYDYFIGFGNEFYKKILKHYNIEPSKVFDGFVYDKKYENQFEDKEIDIWYQANSGTSYYEALYYSDLISYLDIKNINYKLIKGTNLNADLFTFLVKSFCRKTFQEVLDASLDASNEKYIYIKKTDPPNKYINNCKVLYYGSLLNSRIYQNTNRKNIITTGFGQNMYFNTFNHFKIAENLGSARDMSMVFSFIKNKSIRLLDPLSCNLFDFFKFMFFQTLDKNEFYKIYDIIFKNNEKLDENFNRNEIDMVKNISEIYSSLFNNSYFYDIFNDVFYKKLEQTILADRVENSIPDISDEFLESLKKIIANS